MGLHMPQYVPYNSFLYILRASWVDFAIDRSNLVAANGCAFDGRVEGPASPAVGLRGSAVPVHAPMCHHERKLRDQSEGGSPDGLVLAV